MTFKRLVAFAVLGLVLGVTRSSAYPIHASCKLTWTWDTDCGTVMSALLAAIKELNTTDCGTGEVCRYQLVSSTSTEIKTNHTTPVKHYVDSQTFEFSDTGKECTVKASSSSNIWYAVLDSGTNYCNLHNLVTYSKLNTMYNFQETTSDDVCTQYSSADCSKY